jgi:hypothetical protein
MAWAFMAARRKSIIGNEKGSHAYRVMFGRLGIVGECPKWRYE